MANTLSKIGITTGNTVTAGHVTQSIDAFTGTEAYDITLSGSFTMSGGEITGVAGVENPLTASYATTASYSTTASYATTASYVATASYALNANTASYALNATPTFPYTGSAIITGSLRVEGNTRVTSSLRVDGTTRLESTLTTVGSVERNYVEVSDISNGYNVLDTDHIITFAGGGSGTITLPTATNGRELILINLEGGKASLEGPTNSVNGVTTYELPISSSYTQTTVYSIDGSWYVSNI